MKKTSVDLKNRILSRKNIKIGTGITALALASALTISLVLDTPINPVLEAQAKETFSDISTIVSNHSESEDEPFTILDVVPGKASYDYVPVNTSEAVAVDLSLATLGYLDRSTQSVNSPAGRPLSGSEPILADLAKAYSTYSGVFNNVSERYGLINKVYKEEKKSITKANGDVENLVELKYEEVYAGTREGFDSSDGWTLMLPLNYNLNPPAGSTDAMINTQFFNDFVSAYNKTWGTSATFDSEQLQNSLIAQLDKTYHVTSGNFRGTFLKYDTTASPALSKEGYDYILLEKATKPDIPAYNARTVFKNGSTSDAHFQVKFSYDSSLTGKGYEINSATNYSSSSHSSRTLLYKKIDNIDGNGHYGYEPVGIAENIDESERSGLYVVIFKYTESAASGTVLYKRDKVTAIQIRSDGKWPSDSYFIDPDYTDSTPPLLMSPPLMSSPGGYSSPDSSSPSGEGSGKVTFKYEISCSESTGELFGGVDKVTEEVNLPDGSPAGSKATAKEGYEFVKWTDGSGNLVSESFSFTPSLDGKSAGETYTYTAHFIPAEGGSASDPDGVLGARRDKGVLGKRRAPDPTDLNYYFVYVGPGKGDYKLTETQNSTDKNIFVFNAPVYVRCINDGDGNRAKSFLRECVFAAAEGQENANSQFKIKIRTITAKELTSEIVSEADLIYLEDGYLEHIKVPYDDRYMHLEYIERNDEKDMSWQSAYSVLERVVSSGLPIIVDHKAAYDIERNSQDEIIAYHRRYNRTYYQRLAMILSKESVSNYYDTVKTGIMTDQDAFNKLFDWDTILNTERFPTADTNSYNYVKDNIFVNNDGSLLMGGTYMFTQFFEEDYANKGFSEVLSAIDTENAGKSEELQISRRVAKSRAVQYIMCKVVADFRDIRILEIQPTANGSSNLTVDQDNKKNSTRIYWQSSVSTARTRMLSSSKRINVSVNTISVDQFNSDLEDINANYSMIFIGLDGQRLNRDDQSKSVFNNSGLNGLSYMASGDSSGSGNYEGFDLLPVKETALYHFMDAGYPVVVEDACFTNKSAQKNSGDALRINTAFVQEGSRMYNFLARAVSDYHGNIYTVSDVHNSAQFLSRINISRPYVEQTNFTSKVVDVIKDAGGFSNATISFKVSNGLTQSNFDDSGNLTGTERLSYNDESAIALYFDMNEDGVFAAEEMVPSTAYYLVGDSVMLNLTGVTKGLIPWSLEVYNPSNSYRRSSITGYLNVKDSYCNTIRVLQVMADGSKSDTYEDTAYNLENAYMVYNSNKGSGYNTPTMGYFLEGAEGIVNSKFDIKSMTVSEITTELSGDGTKAANPNFIKSFDVLVLGLGTQHSLSGTALAVPVAEYISSGRPAVYCDNGSNVLSFGIAPSLLGMKDSQMAYSYLGLQGGSYKRFAGINNFNMGSGFGAEQNNEGAISNFPYGIESRISISENIGVQAYILNYDNNISGTSTVSDASDKFENVTAFWTLTGGEGSRYFPSPKDGRNNYYVYSKSNVYYVGQTQYPYLYTEGNAPSEGVDECKIFVNALINAYNVGLKTPKVQIVAGYAKDSPEIESLMVGDNLTHTEPVGEPPVTGDAYEVVDDMVEVYFRVADYNLASSKTTHVSFYYESSSGALTDLGDRYMNAVAFASKVWHVVGNKEVEVTDVDVNGNYILNPGETYKIKAPVITLKNERGRTMADIYVVAGSDVVKFDGNVHTLTNADSVRLVRTQLFDLE